MRVNQICRDNHIKYFCGDVWGYYGYFFTDLGEHEYSMYVCKAIAVACRSHACHMYMFPMYREVQKEVDGIVDLDGPRKKRSKLDPELVTVKEVCVCMYVYMYIRHLPPLSLSLSLSLSLMQTCSFCSLSKALSTDWSNKPAKYFRRTPPTYFIIHSK